MPRKRATRGAAARAKPVLRVSDSDSIINKMDVEERQKRLDQYLRDFDSQAKAYRKKLEQMVDDAEAYICQTFERVLQQFTTAERDMTIKEYIAKLERDDEMEDKENAEDLPTELPQLVPASQSILSKYRSKRIIETIPEDPNSEVPTTVKRPVRRRTKKEQSVTFNEMSSRFITPASSRTVDPLNPWGNTPLVTPKFDPRLPVTPAQKRRAKPGETVVVMSLAGSPIELNGSGGSGKTAGHRPRGSTLQIVKEGKGLQLMKEGESTPELCIDEEELSNIDMMLKQDTTNSNLGKMMNMLKLMVEKGTANNN